MRVVGLLCKVRVICRHHFLFSCLQTCQLLVSRQRIHLIVCPLIIHTVAIAWLLLSNTLRGLQFGDMMAGITIGIALLLLHVLCAFIF